MDRESLVHSLAALADRSTLARCRAIAEWTDAVTADPGDGALPLTELIQALAPDMPFSMELRSAALRTGYTDPLHRAGVVLAASRAMLERVPVN